MESLASSGLQRPYFRDKPSRVPLKKNILLTGGNGFIGSHTIIELFKNNIYKNYNIIVIDNLVNSSKKNIKLIKKIIYPNDYIFYKGTILDKLFLEKIFTNHHIYAVIHLAALKYTNESVKYPLLYYQSNISGTINLLNVMNNYNVKNLVFASSLRVYDGLKSPLNENNKAGDGIITPYGQTKYFMEEILKRLTDWNIFILRIFNVVGALEDGSFADNFNRNQISKMQFLVNVAKNTYYKENNSKYKYVKIYGDDYNTRNGTYIKDFIDVSDVARANIMCLDKFKKGACIINIGSGKGTSIMELIKIFENILKIKIPYKILNRNEVNFEEYYCNINKAKKILNWVPTKNIIDICKDLSNAIINKKL